MGKRVVIYTPDWGIYLGCAMGLGFWTLLDPAGQPEAVTFDSEDEAHEHISSWEEQPQTYSLASIEVEKQYATIAELKAAGLSNLLGDMEADALRYSSPAGSA